MFLHYERVCNYKGYAPDSLSAILLQLGLAVYCGAKIFREGVQNLNRWAWLFICLLVNVIGPVLFLLVGRRKKCK